MDREASSSDTTSIPGYIGAKRLPPWEITDIPRIPHMTRSAPTLSKAEMRALPSLWATTASGRPDNPDSDESFDDSIFSSSSPPTRNDTGSYSERKPSLVDSARTTSPHHIEHKHVVPAYGQSYEPVSSCHLPPPVVALPGTMSSRTTPSQSNMAKSKAYNRRQHKKGSKGSKDSTPLSHRFATAVKELFRKDPVNDKQFERIGKRHWSED